VRPRLIYLHGFASGPNSGKARLFRERFKELGLPLEVPELAEGEFGRLTLTGQLAVVERTAAGEAVSLLGSSLGGYLAALYAARHAEVVKVVLLAPAFDFARRWTNSLGHKQLEEWRRMGTMEVYHYGLGRPEGLGYQFYEDALRYEDYPCFGQPALVVHGLRDEVVSPDLSGEFCRRRANARLKLVDSDHQLLDVFDFVWEQASRFLLEH